MKMRITESTINRLICEAIEGYMEPDRESVDACTDELVPMLDSLLDKYGITTLYEVLDRYTFGLRTDLAGNEFDTQ
jgi:hypothetical protein